MKRTSRNGARLQALMDNRELAVLVIGKVIEDCNAAACELLARARADLVGRSPLDVSAREQADGTSAELGGRARIEGALGGQPQWFPWRFRRPGGGEVSTLVHLETTQLNGRRRLVAHIRDLSPLLRAEMSLRESEFRLQQVLDQTDAVVFWKDLAGRYLFVNDAFCRLVGETAGAIIGKRDEEVMPAEVAARLRANDRQVLARRRPVAFEEQGVFLGELRTYLVNKFPLIDPAGEPYAVCGIATDITERKRVEDALRSASLAVSSASGDNVFQQLVRYLATTLDSDWAFVAVRRSESACRMHVLALWDGKEVLAGFDYELTGTPCETVVGRTFRIYPQRLIERFPLDTDFARLGMQSYAGYPLCDGAGQPLGLISVVSRRPLPEAGFVESVMKIFAVRAAAEIERDHMVAALRASEENYRTIFEASEDCIFVHDFDSGALVDVNPRACAVYGFDHDTMLGLRAGDLGTGEAPYAEADANRWLERARAGEVVRFEWCRRNADGGRSWDEVFLKRIKLAGHERILAVTRDVTARKMSVEAIARSEDRLRATVEAAIDCIITMDEHGLIRAFNPAAERCFGYPGEAVIGRRLDELLIPERFRAAHRRGVARFLADGEGPFIGRRVEVVARRADGGEFPAELAIAVAEGAEGRIFVGYLRDITERKRAEDERAALEAQLRQAQKMEAIGHLAGGIAHDFNNILTSINGYLALAEERQEALNDPRLGRYLEQARRGADRARNLVSQLLTFSRGQRGTPRPLSVPALVEELARFLGPMLPAAIALETDCGAGPADVMADPVQIEQVLLNLCINARDALGGSGTITVTVAAHGATHGVCASCRAPVGGAWTELAVCDDGPGIDAAVAERMFEPFFTTKEVGKGSGMGLATVHGIVHELGGHLLVDTAPGRGARFRVLLPRLDVTPPRSATAPGAPDGAGRADLHGRVLLVDDERMVAEVLCELLVGWGLEVTVAADGLAARDAFAASPEAYDLVLTDHTMPRMTGLELAREVRRIRPGAPVVVFSGYAEGLTEGALAAAGACLLLHKPVEPAALFARLADLLAVRRVEVGEAE